MEKKVKIAIATNIYQIAPQVYASHCDMFYKLGKNHEKFEIVFFGPWRRPIDVARNHAAQLALVHECDYVMFYDDDMFFHSGQDVIRLINRVLENREKIHILQGMAYIRGYPFNPMMFKRKMLEPGKDALKIYEDYAEYVDPETGLVDVDAVGCCLTLIDTRLFKMIPQPWFLTGQQNTEDVYFCVKAKEYVNNVGVYVDTNVEVGHLLEPIILTKFNRDILKKFHEEHGINQLFLPDPTFIHNIMHGNQQSLEQVENRINPLEALKED